MPDVVIAPDLRVPCSLCSGTGFRDSSNFRSAGEMDVKSEPTTHRVTCYLCHGKKWMWALDQQEMAERVSKAEQENVALRADKDHLLACMAVMREKVAKLKAPVSDEEWSCVPLEGATPPVLKTLATLRVLFDWLIKARAADVDALIAARGREGE